MLQFVDKLDRTTRLYATDYNLRFNATDRNVRTPIRTDDALTVMNAYERALLLAVTRYVDAQTTWKPFNTITWKIGKSREDLENNLPHTHGDVILMPYRFKDMSFDTIARTLFHEKVHIYQRMHPLDTLTLFTQYWGLRLEGYEATTSPNSRTNPDTNRLRFDMYNPEAQSMGRYEATFVNAPRKLTDITYVFRESHSEPVIDRTYFELIRTFRIHQYEHPNETMACLFTSIVFDKVHHAPTLRWVNTHLKQRTMH